MNMLTTGLSPTDDFFNPGGKNNRSRTSEQHQPQMPPRMRLTLYEPVLVLYGHIFALISTFVRPCRLDAVPVIDQAFQPLHPLH